MEVLKCVSFFTDLYNFVFILRVNWNLSHTVRPSNIPFLQKLISSRLPEASGQKLGNRDGVVVRSLASHQCVPRVRFPDPASYVGWVCCWFSTLLREVFLRVLRVLRFSPLLKNQHFQILIWSWNSRTFLNEFLWTPWCSVGKQTTYLQLHT